MPTPETMQPAPPALPPDAASADDPALVTRVTYNVFIILITLMSLGVIALFYLVPLPERVRDVLYFLNYVDALILLFDFAVRLRRAPRKLHYLLPLGLLDLLGSLPGLPLLRLLRLPSLVIHWRELRHRTSVELRHAVRARLAESTLLSGILVVLLVTGVGGMAMVYVEAPAAGSNIKTGADALWYALVTIATVGYGDRYPVTAAGRLIGSAMILVGVGIFSVLTGFISTQFLSKRHGAAPGESERLRQEVGLLFAQERQAAAADRAALAGQIAALEAQIATLAADLTQRDSDNNSGKDTSKD